MNINDYKNPVFTIPFITKFLRLVAWKFFDLFQLLKIKNRVPHLYGIYGYFGLPGYGKTIAMTKYLLDIRRKYGTKVHIITNYGFMFEDEPFLHWEQLLKEYDKPLICAWDEVQNEFSSRDFKSFPTELLTLLTQNRKGNGKQILYTAQRWTRVDLIFREQTFECRECRTRFGRLTGLKSYDWEDYQMLLAKPDVNERIKIKPKYRESFIQTNFIRNAYDSFQMLESAKKKKYMSREELSKIRINQ